jgi:hypothetical protein
MELLARLGELTRLGGEAYRNAYLDGMRTNQLAQLRRAQERAAARARAARMAAKGFDAGATVVGSRYTGQQIAGEDVVELDLTIAIEGLPPYELQVRRAIPSTAAGCLEPGATLAVKVDPDDQSVVWIDFDRAG